MNKALMHVVRRVPRPGKAASEWSLWSLPRWLLPRWPLARAVRTGPSPACPSSSIGWPRWTAAASAYSELMATVGAALSRAESGGRDQVQMIGTTWGLSAISGGNRGGRGGSAGAGSTGGSRTDVPIALRRAQFS